MRLTAIVAVLLLAACQTPPGSAPVAQQRRSVGPPRGIDLPIDASDVLNELRDSGVDFVARYYRDPASRWPTLSAAEAQRLSSLGLKIVAVWESHSADRAYFAYGSGYSDAMNAYRQAKTVAQPAGSAIYFAVDYNAKRDELDPVRQYFSGIKAGFAAAGGGRPEYKIGVYGSGAVCETIKLAGLAQYSWLSNATAWTGSRDYSDWDIRQGARLSRLSFNHDSDDARDEYGAFRLANYAIAAPTDVAISRDTGPATPPAEQSLASKLWPSL